MVGIGRNDIISHRQDYDAVIVDASLAGCAAAILLGRAGARVALAEQRPDPVAYKRTGALAGARLDALGVDRGAARARRPGGEPAPRAARPAGPRGGRGGARSRSDARPGRHRLLREDGAFRGIAVRDRRGEETTLRGRLIVGADGRDSHTAELSGVATKTLPRGRFAYGAYFEGAPPANAPDSSLWFLDPDIGAAFPTDSDLVFYVAMPTKNHLAEFKHDLEGAFVSFVAGLLDAPPIREGRRVSAMIGKLEMPNRVRGPVAPGLALIGDAPPLATDPLFGVGCGWAFQSAEWLADSVAPALAGEESLERGLARYRRRHRRELRLHAFQIHDYATGRRFTRAERMLMAAAAADPELAARFDAFATRRIGPPRALATILPRAIAVSARRLSPN